MVNDVIQDVFHFQNVKDWAFVYWPVWYQTEKPTFLGAIIVERIRKKVEKCMLDIKFLTRYRDGNLYPTFTKV